MTDLRFNRAAKFSLAAASDCAKDLKLTYVGTEHLLLGLLKTAPELFPGDSAVEDLEDRVYARVGLPTRRKGTRSAEKLPYTSLAKKVFKSAQGVARQSRAASVDAMHLLSALVADKGIAGEILTQSGFQWDWAGKTTTDGRSRDAALELVRIDDESELPYYEQIVAQIKEAVAAGDLNPGDRLPSVRSLADHLELAPGTVARAFAFLEREGVVETSGPRGTTVAFPQRRRAGTEDRIAELAGLLRPVVVSAFHLGGTADELFEALQIAVAGVFDDPVSDGGGPG
jgi:DNA-binding transcriptional regulator YhcF (GntR family)